MQKIPVPFVRCWRDAADADRMHEGTSLPNMLALATKIGNEESKSIQKLRPLRRHEIPWKEAVYYIDPMNTKVADFKPLLEAAFKRLTGD